MLQLLFAQRAPVLVGLLLAVLPLLAFAAARARGREVDARWALLLAALPLGAVLVEADAVRVALEGPGDGKLDARSVGFLRATEALVLQARALVALVSAVALVRSYRPVAAAALPAALVGVGAAEWLAGRLPAVALLEPTEKAAFWTATLAGHALLTLAAFVVAAGVCLAVPRTARALALVPVLPLLAWPGWIPLLLLG